MLWAVFAREGEGSSLLINLIPMLEQTEKKKTFSWAVPSTNIVGQGQKNCIFCGKKVLYVFITQMVF